MAGKRSRWRMRCKAGRRAGAKQPHDGFTIRRAPKFYKRSIKCPYCKSEDVVSVEAVYIKKEAKREKCYCGNVPHPHRKGAHRFCEAHPKANEPATIEEEINFQDVLNNKRRTAFR